MQTREQKPAPQTAVPCATCGRVNLFFAFDELCLLCRIEDARQAGVYLRGDPPAFIRPELLELLHRFSTQLALFDEPPRLVHVWRALVLWYLEAKAWRALTAQPGALAYVAHVARGLPRPPKTREAWVSLAADVLRKGTQ